MAKNLYTAHAVSKGGRSGHVETDDKRLSFDLTPSDSKTGTNPEQLFACGYSACFGSAVDAVMKDMGLNAKGVSVAISIDLKQDDKGYFLGAVIDVTIPDTDEVLAQQIVQKAHQKCPYSKATRGNIDVELKVSGKPVAKAA